MELATVGWTPNTPMPEGWTVPTRVSMINSNFPQSQWVDASKVTEILVKVPMTGNPTTDAQAAVNAAVQTPEAAQAILANAVGAGTWTTDPNTLAVFIMYARP